MSNSKILFLLAVILVDSLVANSEKHENAFVVESVVINGNVGRNYLNNIYFYGVGTKSDDNVYSGFGLKYDSNLSFYNFEKKENDYNKTTFIHRLDIDEKFYKKLGFAHLDKKATVLGKEDFIEQMSAGLSLGFGNSNNYNFEIGYVINRLEEAFIADTTSDTIYVEVVLKEDFILGSLDSTVSYQSSSAYDKREDTYSSTLGYYPIDDIRTTIKYSSAEHTEDEYKVRAGLNYKFKGLADFSQGVLTPLLTASMNTSENVKTTFDYKYNISNRSLKVKDKFKELVSTSNIIAKKVNSSEFEKRTAE